MKDDLSRGSMHMHSPPPATANWARSWLVILCGGLFYGYQYILRVSPNMMKDELMQAFSVDATQLGMIIACYYHTYAAAQIPLGIVMDRQGPKRLLMLAALVCAVSCIGFSLTTNAYLAGAARLLMGLGSACGFLGTLKLGALWFPPTHMGRVIAVAMVAGTCGATLGGAPLEYMINALGWRAALQVLGVAGLVLAGCMRAFIRTQAPFTPVLEVQTSAWQQLRAIIANPQSWLIASFGMLMYMPIATLGDLWGVSFISSKYGVSETVAATVMAAMVVGVGAGSPVMAYLSDYLRSRRIPMLIGAVSTAALYALLVLGPAVPFEMLYVLFFAAGFLFNGQSLCFAAAAETNPRHVSGTALGFTNMIVMVSGVAGHPMVGRLLDLRWDGATAHGIRTYSVANYEFALALIPCSLALAVLMVLWMKETYPKSPVSRVNPEG